MDTNQEMKAYEVDRHIMPGIPKPALKLKVERKDKALRRYQPLIDAGILWSPSIP